MGHQGYQKNKFKKCLETNDNGTTICQNIWDATKFASKREVLSNRGLPQEARKISINNEVLHINELEKLDKRKPMIVGGRK